MKNNLQKKILNGDNVIGGFTGFGSPAIVESMGLTGMDFVIIDTEHGPGDIESTESMIFAAEARQITPIVRVKDSTRPSILKMLDIGAMGLMVPFVKSVEEVKQVIEYGKYPPMGQRGFGPGRAAGFGTFPGFSNPIEYFEGANDKTLIIPQCETVEALECIEEIVALEGVAGIFLGPYDLSVAMGIPLEFGNPKFIAAVERTVKACREAGKFCLTIAISGEAAKDNFAKGFHGSAFYDSSLILNAFSSFAQQAKG